MSSNTSVAVAISTITTSPVVVAKFRRCRCKITLANEGGGHHSLRMTFKGGFAASALNVPKHRSAVAAARSDALSVGREGYPGGYILVSAHTEQCLSSLDVPKAGLAVCAGGCKEVPAGRKGDAANGDSKATEDSDKAARGSFPDPDLVVRGRSGDEVALGWRKSGAGHLSLVALEAPQHRTFVARPKLGRAVHRGGEEGLGCRAEADGIDSIGMPLEVPKAAAILQMPKSHTSVVGRRGQDRAA